MPNPSNLPTFRVFLETYVQAPDAASAKEIGSRILNPLNIQAAQIVPGDSSGVLFGGVGQIRVHDLNLDAIREGNLDG